MADSWAGQIRLSSRQREALEGALEEVTLPPGTEVYLFGSRVDPKARGGDVDVLIYAPGVDVEELRRSVRRAFERRLAERIDVVVIDPNDPDEYTRTFADTVQKERIR